MLGTISSTAHYVLNDYSTRTPGCIAGTNSSTWESLETRRRNAQLTMLYRIQHGLVNIQPDRYLQHSERRTRGEHRLSQERIGSETYSNSFFPRTIRDWNMLPSGTTSAQLLEGFRQTLLFATQYPATRQPVMYIVLSDFKLYIYILDH